MNKESHIPRVLLTGFSPFGKDVINPSWEAVKFVQPSSACVLFRLEIPTVFYQSAQVLQEEIVRVKPDIVLCVGQAGGRENITPECRAVNLNDAKSPDNAGNILCGEVIQPDAPSEYFTNLPVERMVAALQAEGIPAQLSHSAGTFVCNHLFFSLMHLIHQQYPEMLGGFVHIPCIPGQVIPNSVMRPTLPLDTIVHALKIMLDCVVSDWQITMA